MAHPPLLDAGGKSLAKFFSAEGHKPILDGINGILERNKRNGIESMLAGFLVPLVPKFHLGTFIVPREISFRANL
jgi:hypothetical protein